MPKPRNIIPSTMLTVALPQDEHTRLFLHLYSEVAGRVPQGAYRAWIVARIREFFTTRKLDLAPYAGCEPDTYFIGGTPAALEILEQALKGTRS